jgi:hypothetical protein
MATFLSYFFTVCLSFGAGYFAHVLSMKRESSTRLRVLRDLLYVELEKLERIDLKSLQPGDLYQAHQKSVTILINECAKIQEDIRYRNRQQFKAAHKTYSGLQKQDVEPYDRYDPVSNPTAILFPNYEKGRDRLAGLLRSMMNYTK